MRKSSLLHQTNIADFREKMGWHKEYCRMGVYFVWPVRLTLFVARLFKRPSKSLLPSKYYRILESLWAVQDLAEATRKRQPG